MSRRSYRAGPSRPPSSAVRPCLDAMAVCLSARWLRATPPATAGSSLTGTENFRAHDHGGAVPGE
jgi:hypothetical protein